MPDLVILAIGLGSGCPLPLLGAVAGVMLAPPQLVAPVLVAGVILAKRSAPRTPADGDESGFLRAVAAELEAGATLRTALIAATDRTPGLALDDWVRRAAAGRPLADLAPQLGARLPVAGRAAAAAISFAAASGGASVGIFTGLAQQADDALAVQRERSVATAQARFSALIVAGAPVPVLVWLAVRGTFSELMAVPAGRLVLAMGIGFELSGIVTTVAMLRRARNPDDGLVLLGDLILLGLLSGMPFVTALGAAAPYLDAPLASEVSSIVRSSRHGGSEVAFGSHHGALHDLLRLAARATATGAPLTAAIAGFTLEARSAQRARAFADSRRLGVRLLFPLAFLILPGFIVLVAGPVVLDGISRLIA